MDRQRLSVSISSARGTGGWRLVGAPDCARPDENGPPRTGTKRIFSGALSLRGGVALASAVLSDLTDPPDAGRAGTPGFLPATSAGALVDVPAAPATFCGSRGLPPSGMTIVTPSRKSSGLRSTLRLAS